MHFATFINSMYHKQTLFKCNPYKEQVGTNVPNSFKWGGGGGGGEGGTCPCVPVVPPSMLAVKELRRT